MDKKLINEDIKNMIYLVVLMKILKYISRKNLMNLCFGITTELIGIWTI